MRIITFLSTIIFILLFSFSSCSDEQIDGMSKEQRDQELRDFLNSITRLDTISTFPIEYKDINEIIGPEIYRYDEIDKKYDYYHPKTITTAIYGQEPVSNMLVTQSEDIIWPGNIIQGKSVVKGNLAPIPLGLSRKPGRIYLNVVSSQDMCYYRDIYTFTGSEVIQVMNDIMAEHKHGLPADVTYVQNSIYNEEEMAYHLDMDEDEFSYLTRGAFNKIAWGEKKNRIMVKLVQVYFQMVYEFDGLHEVFKDNIKIEELQPYVGDKNPMCYISSVSYGRYFVLLYESNSSYEKLSQAINNTFNKDIDTPLSQEDINIMKSTSVTLRQVGGNADAGLQTISGDAEKIREFVQNGATANQNNVGAPIFYNIRYMGNSFPIKTYKKINSQIERLEYVRAKKNNDVTIEIKDIRSEGVYLTGGNFKKLNKANVSVGRIEVEVKNENTTIKTLYFDPNIKDVGTKSTFHKSCNYRMNLGELGENTTKRIKISFPVTYYTKRKNTLGTESKSESKTFEVTALYKFNSKTEKWEKDSNDMNSTIINMSSMIIKANFNHCAINFRLNYSFSANKETY